MKAVLFLTVLLFLMIGAVITFQEPEVSGQVPEVPRIPDSEAKFDTILNRVEKKVDRAEKPKPKEKVRTVYRNRIVGFYKPVEFAKVAFDSLEVCVPVTMHQGVAVIDGNYLNQQIALAQDSIIDAPLFVDTLIEEVDNHISAWQQVKNFITKPFKRKKDQ